MHLVFITPNLDWCFFSRPLQCRDYSTFPSFMLYTVAESRETDHVFFLSSRNLCFSLTPNGIGHESLNQ